MSKLGTSNKYSGKSTTESKSFIPEKYQDLLYTTILALSVFVFLWSAITGNGFNATDTLASLSFKNYLHDADKSGEFPLWVPYIFSGMPSYAALLTTGNRIWDISPKLFYGVTQFVGALFSSDTARVASFYSIYAIGMYLLLRSKSIERFASFFGAFAATFSTSVIVWIMIGHNTKPNVICLLPFVFLSLEKIREKFSILYSVLLVVLVHLMLEAGHLQMIFYSFMAIGLYLLFELVSRVISKEAPMGVIRAAGILAVAGGFAFLMSSDRYMATREYTPYSTRGSASSVAEMSGKTDAEGGNPYEYATMWSFSPEEIKTFFVPNFYGFGHLGVDQATIDNGGMISQLVGPDGRIYSYFSQKEIEDAPPYMGIAVLFLGLFGIISNRKNIFVQFLAVLAVFALILSFGKTVPVLYDLFYHNIPNFNKFRAPSMVLVLVQFAMPILAAFGLSSIYRWYKNGMSKSDEKLLYGFIGASAFFLVFAIIYSSIFQSQYHDMVRNSKLVASYAQGASEQVKAQLGDELATFTFSQMISDWYVTAGILLATFAFIFLFVRRTISTTVFVPVILLLLVFDLWRVDYRPYAVAPEKLEENAFKRTPLIDALQADNSMYRIADFGIFQSPNTPAYFKLQTVNGYHSAKLRVYQDVMDATSGGSTNGVSNPYMWNLLNVKYIISNRPMGQMPTVFPPQQVQAYVYLNPDRIERAQFVNKVEVKSSKEILNMFKDDSKFSQFKAKELAYVEKAINTPIDTITAEASAKVTSYKNEEIKIEANASGNNFLVISEVYYPEGWKAYIDGKETEIHKTNFALRGIVVPKGKHTIEMKFTSNEFEFGKKASLFTNILLFLALCVGLVYEKKSLPLGIQKLIPFGPKLDETNSDQEK